MTEHEALTALSHLIGLTNGWDDPLHVDTYVRQLMELDDPVMLTRACQSVGRGWDQLSRPPISAILESYDRECRFAATRQIDPQRVHCDGSGRIRRDGRLVPCPRCNPALAAVYDDPTKLSRYLHEGTPIEQLDVGVERVRDRIRYRDGYHPPVCWQQPDDPSTIPDRATARQIMWDAYRSEVEAQGRKPSLDHFEALAGELVKERR